LLLPPPAVPLPPGGRLSVSAISPINPTTAGLPLRCHLERRAKPEVETRRATEGRISQIAEFPLYLKGNSPFPRDPNALHLPYGFRLRQTRSVFLSRSKMTRGGVFCGTERTAIPHNLVVASPIYQNLKIGKRRVKPAVVAGYRPNPSGGQSG
jgi:hypothetical protein